MCIISQIAEVMVTLHSFFGNLSTSCLYEFSVGGEFIISAILAKSSGKANMATTVSFDTKSVVSSHSVNLAKSSLRGTALPFMNSAFSETSAEESGFIPSDDSFSLSSLLATANIVFSGK